MKKLIVLSLIAILLIGMLAFSACKAKVEEAVEETTEEVVDTVDAVVDTMATQAAEAVTP